MILQPLFLLFVFGRILTDLGYTRAGYAQLLFPGIVALTATLTSLQSTAFPLVIEFSSTKEIEDRLFAPLPVAWVAAEKLIYASLRALYAAAVMFAVRVLHPGIDPLEGVRFAPLVAIIILGALNGAALGLTLGTWVPPNRINVLFALVLTPLLFTGCSQYPWPSLSRLAWFKWLATLNPLTYRERGNASRSRSFGPAHAAVDQCRDVSCLLRRVRHVWNDGFPAKGRRLTHGAVTLWTEQGKLQTNPLTSVNHSNQRTDAVTLRAFCCR